MWFFLLQSEGKRNKTYMGAGNSVNGTGENWSHFTCSSCQGHFEGHSHNGVYMDTRHIAWYCLDCRAKLCDMCYINHPSTISQKRQHAAISGPKITVVHRVSGRAGAIWLTKSEDFTRSIEFSQLLLEESGILSSNAKFTTRFKTTRVLYFDSDDDVSDVDESQTEESIGINKESGSSYLSDQADFNLDSFLEATRKQVFEETNDSILGLTCPIHLSYHADNFCREHLLLGCNVCMAVFHSKCTSFIRPFHVGSSGIHLND